MDYELLSKWYQSEAFELFIKNEAIFEWLHNCFLKRNIFNELKLTASQSLRCIGISKYTGCEDVVMQMQQYSEHTYIAENYKW